MTLRAELDPSIEWIDVLGVGMLAGVGFTVSLLIGKLAFMLVCCGTTVSLIVSLMAAESFIRKASRPL